jgi:hypothetical protein
MIEINPDLVMTQFTQNMIGFFYLISIIGVVTVASVWFWLYWQKVVNKSEK